ncbi:Imm50 family immunity protein [Streptomyces sp. HNM0574]|uniref:Imm50 family immunity protein n=1 Tax=Streptomyces sp. HNM0574 TaxID=2714954 RepID=UPI00146DB1BB|nr:Imm50 family immunity protein [Streptomyces sp. HNM0574]NLU66989.1 hypothetical protein [Streptomyces sp. HNM0574]
MTADSALRPANPQQLTDLYGRFPEYGRLRIRSVNVNPYGPTLTLRVDLPEGPEAPPEQWQTAECDTVQCHFQFQAVENLALSRWEPPTEAHLKASRLTDRTTEVRVTGAGIALTFQAHPQFLIRHISGFRSGTTSPEHHYLNRLDAKLHGTGEPATTTETFHAR